MKPETRVQAEAETETAEEAVEFAIYFVDRERRPQELVDAMQDAGHHAAFAAAALEALRNLGWRGPAIVERR